MAKSLEKWAVGRTFKTTEAMDYLGVSRPTALRQINALLASGAVTPYGGKTTRYYKGERVLIKAELILEPKPRPAMSIPYLDWAFGGAALALVVFAYMAGR